MRKTALLLSFVLGLVSAVTAADGTASGTLTVKGVAAKMTHSYAMYVPNPMDKAKQAIRLVLTDGPVPANVLADPSPFGFRDLARANKLHAMEALISVPDKACLATQMYDQAFKMTASVAGTDIKLEIKTLDKTTIAGKLYTAKPLDFNDVPFEYSITFSAPITAGK